MCDYLSNNLELCLLMEWFWRRTGDDQFLWETLYSILREILTFFRGYAKRGAYGLFHLEPVSALEALHPVSDDTPDLCGLHYFLPRDLEWGKVIGEAEDMLTGWQDFLDGLPPLPVGRWTMTRQFEDGIHVQVRKVFADAPIAIPGAYGYGLKEIVRAVGAYALEYRSPLPD